MIFRRNIDDFIDFWPIFWPTDFRLAKSCQYWPISDISVIFRSIYSIFCSLVISKNPFSSLLLDSVGNLSSSLQHFRIESCNIKGPVPKGIGALRNFNMLALSDNNLSGTIPSTIKGIKSLQRLYLDENQLEQSIPTEICLLANLG